MRKYLFLAICFIFFLAGYVFAAQVETTVTTENIYQTILKVKSEEEMYGLKIYKQVESKYVLFYKTTSKKPYKEKTINIPYTLLSEEHETKFKIVINDDIPDKRIVKEITIDKVDPKVSMNPEETAKPTTTDWVIPTKPTPTTTSSALPTSESSPQATGSENPSSSAQPTSTSDEDTIPLNNEDIAINVNILMLDNVNYNFADLEANINNTLPYTENDIIWKIEDSDVAVFSKDSKYYKSVRGKTAKVRGNGFGDTTLTASLPNGKSATCKVKVIISSKEKAPSGDRTAPVAKYDNVVYHRSDRPYYIREESISWGDEYVEAYINNAAKLIRTYPDYERFKNEAQAKTIYTYIQNDNFKINYDEQQEIITSVKAGHIHKQTDRMSCGKFDEIVYEKEAGELSPNGYLFFFTCKNQWEYLLVLEKPNEKWDEKTNRWKVLDSKMASAGVNRDHFHTYCTMMYLEGDQARLSMRYTGSGKKMDNSCGHLIHYDFLNGIPQYQGIPSSHGCIHLGVYTDKIYYDTFIKAGLGTRMIMF